MKTQIINLALQAKSAQPVILDVQSTLSSYFSWFLGMGGGLLALIGLIELIMAGRQGDSQGKISGAWFFVGGLVIIAMTVIVSMIITAPPAAK